MHSYIYNKKKIGFEETKKHKLFCLPQDNHAFCQLYVLAACKVDQQRAETLLPIEFLHSQPLR